MSMLISPVTMVVLGLLALPLALIMSTTDFGRLQAVALWLLVVLALVIATGAAMTASQMRSGTVQIAVVRGCRSHLLCRLGLPACSRLASFPQPTARFAKDLRAIPRGHGAGTACTRQLLDLADAEQVAVELTCVPDLATRYSRDGFVEIGTSTGWVFPLRKTELVVMRREPQRQR